VSGGVKAVDAELQLQMLCFESGALPQAPGANDGKDRTPQLRYFMQVKDRQTGEACMYWEEPKPQRTTDPAQNSAHDDLTRKLHENVSSGSEASKPSLNAAASLAEAGGGRAIIVGSANTSSASTPRSRQA